MDAARLHPVEQDEAFESWPRISRRRLVAAAGIVAARNPAALLVVAIDAADNAVTAAEANPSRGPSFVPDFARLDDLPTNVRLVVSSRPGRLASLELPSSFERHEIGPFRPEETDVHVRTLWPAAPTAFVEDLHALSGGNPRVQAARKWPSATQMIVEAAALTFAVRARLLAGSAQVADLQVPATSETLLLVPFAQSHIISPLYGRFAIASARLCHLPGIV